MTNPNEMKPAAPAEVSDGGRCAVDALFGDFVRKHALAVESLTEQQLAEVIRQAIAAGDFQRNIINEGGTHKQAVIYHPYREVSRLRPLYDELIYAVATKHDDETRHETALRYITERENRVEGPAMSSFPSPNVPDQPRL